MDELCSTGVPVPFDCAKAVRVEDAAAGERALHAAFGPNRINSQREFLEIDEIQAIVLLDQLGQEDVTPKVNAENESIDTQSRDAAKRLSSRRPSLNLEEMRIPAGAVLSAVNSDGTAEVCGPRKARFRGSEMSPTRATKIARGLNCTVSPCPNRRYQDELPSDVFARTYVRFDE